MPLEEKILPLDRLAPVLAERRGRGQTVVQCHGVFDLLHPGHVEHFAQARRLGDLLVVTVAADRFVDQGPGRPAFPQELRMRALAALELVDFVALAEEATAAGAIRQVRPDVYVLDRTGPGEAEAEAVREAGGRVHVTDGLPLGASSLANRLLYPEETVRYLDDFARRHPAGEVVAHLEGLRDLTALVVGDAVVDQFSYVTPLARSPGDAAVAARFAGEEQFPGGAVAAANQVACFVREVTLVCAANPDDGYLDFFRQALRPNVRLAPLETPDRPTVQKRRFLDSTFRTRLFEIQLLDDSPWPADLEDRLLDLVAGLEEPSLTLAADLGHGLATARLRERLAAEGRFLAVSARNDGAGPGSNPLAAWPRADYAFLHELDVRLARQSRHQDLEALAVDTMRKLHLQRLAIGRGPHGSVLFDRDGGWVRTPALAVSAGEPAGEAVFTLTALGVFRGVPDDVVGFLGSCLGALAAEGAGQRRPVESAALARFVSQVLTR